MDEHFLNAVNYANLFFTQKKEICISTKNPPFLRHEIKIWLKEEKSKLNFNKSGIKLFSILQKKLKVSYNKSIN